MSLVRCMASVALLVPMAGAMAEIYRWVDDEGQTHFTQQVSHDVERRKIDVRASSAQGLSFASQGDIDKMTQERDERTAERKKERARRRAADPKCNQRKQIPGVEIEITNNCSEEGKPLVIFGK